jgi:putative tryptophan/tyrosine transport system substrate-binding protein
MHRRKLLLFSLASFTAPLVAFAQQAKVWRVGFLAWRSRPAQLGSDYFGGFVRGMREHGYVEGKNLTIDWRFADGRTERLLQLASELVKLNVDVIVTASSAATKAAQEATKTIPIVMGSISDPVGSGFVVSLAKPGGNITGLANALADVSAKQVDLLRRIVPSLAHIGVLVNPRSQSHPALMQHIRAAAQDAGIGVTAVSVHSPTDIDEAFTKLRQLKAQAVMVLQDPLMTEQRNRLAQQSRTHRMPSIFAYREYVAAGGLMSYGQDNAERYRRAAAYVDRILRGAKPADLPVEQPMIMELVINRATARLLGIAIPSDLVVSADLID